MLSVERTNKKIFRAKMRKRKKTMKTYQLRISQATNCAIHMHIYVMDSQRLNTNEEKCATIIDSQRV